MGWKEIQDNSWSSPSTVKWESTAGTQWLARALSCVIQRLLHASILALRMHIIRPTVSIQAEQRSSMTSTLFAECMPCEDNPCKSVEPEDPVCSPQAKACSSVSRISATLCSSRSRDTCSTRHLDIAYASENNDWLSHNWALMGKRRSMGSESSVASPYFRNLDCGGSQDSSGKCIGTLETLSLPQQSWCDEPQADHAAQSSLKAVCRRSLSPACVSVARGHVNERNPTKRIERTRQRADTALHITCQETPDALPARQWHHSTRCPNKQQRRLPLCRCQESGLSASPCMHTIGFFTRTQQQNTANPLVDMPSHDDEQIAREASPHTKGSTSCEVYFIGTPDLSNASRMLEHP